MNGAFFKAGQIRNHPCRQGHCEEVPFLNWMVDIFNSEEHKIVYRVDQLTADTPLTTALIGQLNRYSKGEFVITFIVQYVSLS